MEARWTTRSFIMGMAFPAILMAGCTTSRPTPPPGLAAAEQQATSAAARAEQAAQRAEAAASKATAAADRVERAAQRVEDETLQAEQRFTRHMRK